MVDNASVDRTADVALSERPGTALYKLQQNVGYGRANNFALRRTDTEFALLLNPDGFISPANLAALLRSAINARLVEFIAPPKQSPMSAVPKRAKTIWGMTAMWWTPENVFPIFGNIIIARPACPFVCTTTRNGRGILRDTKRKYFRRLFLRMRRRRLMRWGRGRSIIIRR